MQIWFGFILWGICLSLSFLVAVSFGHTDMFWHDELLFRFMVCSGTLLWSHWYVSHDAGSSFNQSSCCPWWWFFPWLPLRWWWEMTLVWRAIKLFNVYIVSVIPETWTFLSGALIVEFIVAWSFVVARSPQPDSSFLSVARIVQMINSCDLFLCLH